MFEARATAAPVVPAGWVRATVQVEAAGAINAVGLQDTELIPPAAITLIDAPVPVAATEVPLVEAATTADTWMGMELPAVIAV